MCDKSTSKQEAKIHTQYNQMPNILILHLLSYGITTLENLYQFLMNEIKFDFNLIEMMVF
jgi:hypothetical protein